MMKTKKCKVCGLIAPADDFPKGRCICKACKRKKDVEYKRNWRKTHTEKKRIKTAEEWRNYREKLKATRGNTYPSDEYAEKRRAYQRAYAEKHKNDEVFKQKRRDKARRYRELLKERKIQDGRNI
jgi:hypothetical protein